MSELGEIVPKTEFSEEASFIINEYDGSYSKHLSLSTDILNQLHTFVGDVSSPLYIREGGLRFRNYEDKEEYVPYRLTKFGQSDLLQINSAMIDEMVRREEDERLGHLSDQYKEEERHEMMFVEIFAKEIQSGIYEWAKKKLNTNLKKDNLGLLTRIKKNRALDKFWSKNHNKLVNLSFPEFDTLLKS